MLTKELYVVALIAANIVEETATLIAKDVEREVPRQWERGWIRHHLAMDQAVTALWQVGFAIAAWYALNFIKQQPRLTGWQPIGLLPAATTIPEVKQQPKLTGWQPVGLLAAAKDEPEVKQPVVDEVAVEEVASAPITETEPATESVVEEVASAPITELDPASWTLAELKKYCQKQGLKPLGDARKKNSWLKALAK